MDQEPRAMINDERANEQAAPDSVPEVQQVLSAAWLELEENLKIRLLKQMAEKAPKMLENWMIHAGVPAGVKRVEAARRQGELGRQLDALVADLDRENVWAPIFVQWFKHVKTYMNDACTKVQRELMIANCPLDEVEEKMLAAVQSRYHDDPFLPLFVATVRYHNARYE